MDKILDYMDKIDKDRQDAVHDENWRNSEEYKTHVLNKERAKAKGVCLDKLFAKVYKDAVPLNDEYKVARGDDLDAEIKDFMDAKCPEGMEYYVKERSKLSKNSPLKRIMEAVESLVDAYYEDKERDIAHVDPKDLVFQMSDENLKKLDVISDDLNFNDVAAAINLNVKQTAEAEIARSKDEKEKAEQLEQELKDDLSVTDEDQIKTKLESAKDPFDNDPVYTPSLFEGIMIGNTTKYRTMAESGEFTGDWEYNALAPFGLVKESVVPTSFTEKAFIESVKEMTRLQILKTFKLEDFNPAKTRLMAEEYATEGANEYAARKRLAQASRHADFADKSEDAAKTAVSDEVKGAKGFAKATAVKTGIQKKKELEADAQYWRGRSDGEVEDAGKASSWNASYNVKYAKDPAKRQQRLDEAKAKAKASKAELDNDLKKQAGKALTPSQKALHDKINNKG